LLSNSYFTTESYPAHQRAEAWREMLGRLSLRVRKMSPDNGLFGTVSSAVSPLGIVFARITSGPQELSYHDDNGLGALCLALHMEGDAVLVTDATQTRIGCGDIVFRPNGASGDAVVLGALATVFAYKADAKKVASPEEPVPKELGHPDTTH